MWLFWKAVENGVVSIQWNLGVFNNSRELVNIYKELSSGPKMLPCGTPKVTGRASDNSFSPEVRCFRSLKYDVNHSKALVETPTDDNLDIKIPWSTVSNALVRSRKTAPQMCPFSMFSRTSSAKLDNAVAVERFERKPNSLFESRLFEFRYSCNWEGPLFLKSC